MASIKVNFSAIFNFWNTTKLNIFYKYVDKLPSFSINENSTVESYIDSYKLLDISINRRIRDLFLLSLGAKNVLDVTNIRKKLVSKSLESINSKIICINKYIKEDLNLKDGSNITVLESGFDQDLFYDSSSKHDKIKIVYSGNLQRFGKSRGVVELSLIHI